MSSYDIGKFLKDRRISLNLSLNQIAIYCGVSKSTVSRWESGFIDKIKRGHIYMLSQKLRIPVEIILGLETNQEIEPADIVLKREEITNNVNNIKNLEDLENIITYINVFINKKGDEKNGSK